MRLCDSHGEQLSESSTNIVPITELTKVLKEMAKAPNPKASFECIELPLLRYLSNTLDALDIVEVSFMPIFCQNSKNFTKINQFIININANKF